MSRSVTITNNSTSVPLFAFTSGNNYHVGLTGIRFNEGSGSQNHVRISGTGSKVPLLKDCAFEVKNRFGNQPDISALAILSQGAVIWNSYINGVGSGLGGQCCPEGASIWVNSPRAWNTASTMGSRDTSGIVNVYIEDSTLANIGQAPDVDDNGRVVMRYSVLDGAWGITHGFTSRWGGRHFEYYNNTFRVANTNRNMAGRYFWIRAGTGVFTDNVVNQCNKHAESGAIRTCFRSATTRLRAPTRNHGSPAGVTTEPRTSLTRSMHGTTQAHRRHPGRIRISRAVGRTMLC